MTRVELHINGWEEWLESQVRVQQPVPMPSVCEGMPTVSKPYGHGLSQADRADLRKMVCFLPEDHATVLCLKQQAESSGERTPEALQ